VDVSSSASAKIDFAKIGRRIGLSNLDIDSILDAIANCSETWLLVLDNADELDQDYSQYFPSGVHQGVVLMTSRNHECAAQYGTLGCLPLDGLVQNDARNLLFKAANIAINVMPRAQHDCDAVAELLGYHPLSLIQAGIYVARGHCKMREYPSHHKRQRKRVMTFQPSQQLSRYRDAYATLEASAEKLGQAEDEASKDAIQLLNILSYLNHTAIPFELFDLAQRSCELVTKQVSNGRHFSQWHIDQMPATLQSCGKAWDHFRLREAIRVLVSLSFVETSNSATSDTQELKMHPVTHGWAKDRQSEQCSHQSWISTGAILSLAWVSAVNQTVVEPHAQPWLAEDILKVGLLTAPIMHVAQMIGVVAQQCYPKDGFSTVGKQMERLVSLCSSTLIEECGRAVFFLHFYGMHFAYTGRIEEAFQVWHKFDQQPCEVCEQDPDLNWHLVYDRATAYYIYDKYEEVVELLEALHRQLPYPQTDLRILRSRVLLAKAYFLSGNDAIATTECDLLTQTIDEPSVQRVLLMSSDGAWLYKELALLLILLRASERAVTLLKRYLANTEAARHCTVDQMIDLGLTLAEADRNCGQAKKAIDKLEYVQTSYHAQLQRDRRTSWLVKEILADAYWDVGEHGRAIDLLRLITCDQRKIQGANHPSVLHSERRLQGWVMKLSELTSPRQNGTQSHETQRSFPTRPQAGPINTRRSSRRRAKPSTIRQRRTKHHHPYD